MQRRVTPGVAEEQRLQAARADVDVRYRPAAPLQPQRAKAQSDPRHCTKQIPALGAFLFDILQPQLANIGGNDLSEILRERGIVERSESGVSIDRTNGQRKTRIAGHGEVCWIPVDGVVTLGPGGKGAT